MYNSFKQQGTAVKRLSCKGRQYIRTTAKQQVTAGIEELEEDTYNIQQLQKSR